ncbi:hypothetical protein PHYPSEUDO_012218 [Phytophthora pseudosyringae]|uniref:Uncharacterized protein n=1 Tax=Phytophthora pseudosyringae TaxID=221518 RepID=A0A8T1W5J9_9STRA|nr:hypothetical protein PHYPSEUDO_012218 [Phytophthora pseudosyringae]
MAHAPQLERKRAFRVTSDDGAATKPHSATTRRPSFAARMFSLFFKGRPSPTGTRPKSWSGEPKPTPTAAKDTLVRRASTNVIIPSGSEPSVRPAPGLTKHEQIREESGGDHEDKSDASWRQRQTHCVNCGRLFFISLSTLSCSAARFCSLDCKTTLEYVNHLEEVLAVHMLGGSSDCSDSLGSSSDEGEYDVEEFNVDQF